MVLFGRIPAPCFPRNMPPSRAVSWGAAGGGGIRGDDQSATSTVSRIAAASMIFLSAMNFFMIASSWAFCCNTRSSYRFRSSSRYTSLSSSAPKAKPIPQQLKGDDDTDADCGGCFPLLPKIDRLATLRRRLRFLMHDVDWPRSSRSLMTPLRRWMDWILVAAAYSWGRMGWGGVGEAGSGNTR